VLARGRTGSGKTIAFGAPLVESMLRSQAGKRREFGRSPKALILAPTRELALQIDRTIQPIARSVGLFTTQIYGGVPQARQVGALKKGVDIIIGTPGASRTCRIRASSTSPRSGIVVLDEADHMSARLPRGRCSACCASPADAQKLLFSATLDREVARSSTSSSSSRRLRGGRRRPGLGHDRPPRARHRPPRQGRDPHEPRRPRRQDLVFARTRAYAEMLAEQFDDAGIKARPPRRPQPGQAHAQPRAAHAGPGDVLAATDVAARGIHVDDIDLIQADALDEYKTYLHRSGRTAARAQRHRRHAHHAAAGA
jgi:superfamily II DNA/RNA helicase